MQFCSITRRLGSEGGGGGRGLALALLLCPTQQSSGVLAAGPTGLRQCDSQGIYSSLSRVPQYILDQGVLPQTHIPGLLSPIRVSVFLMRDCTVSCGNMRVCALRTQKIAKQSPSPLSILTADEKRENGHYTWPGCFLIQTSGCFYSPRCTANLYICHIYKNIPFLKNASMQWIELF